jgi:hypothetical protein
VNPKYRPFADVPQLAARHAKTNTASPVRNLKKTLLVITLAPTLMLAESGPETQAKGEKTGKTLFVTITYHDITFCGNNIRAKSPDREGPPPLPPHTVYDAISPDLFPLSSKSREKIAVPGPHPEFIKPHRRPQREPRF